MSRGQNKHLPLPRGAKRSLYTVQTSASQREGATLHHAVAATRHGEQKQSRTD
jgi:hypothetical protein